MKRVLLIDDNQQSSKMITKSLLKNNFKVETVSKMNQIYPAEYNFNPDIVLINASFKDLDSAAVARELINFSENNPTIILMNPVSGLQEKNIDAQIAAILEKPFIENELISKINELLQKRGFTQNCNTLKMTG